MSKKQRVRENLSISYRLTLSRLGRCL